MSRRDEAADPGQDADLVQALRGLLNTDYEVPSDGARTAVRTVRRRVVGRVLGTSLVVAALAIGVPLGLAAVDPSAAPVLVATQDPAPTAPTAPEPSMPAAPTPEAPATGPSAPTSPSAPPGAATTSVGPTAAEPASRAPLVVSVDPSTPVRAGELVGLPATEHMEGIALEHVSASWSLDLCGRSGWTSDAARTGWMSEGYTHESLDVEEAAVYATDGEAQAALTELTEAVQECAARGRQADGTTWTHVVVTDDGLEALQRYLDEPTHTFDDVGDAYATEVVRLRLDGRVLVMQQQAWYYGGGLEVEPELLERMMDTPRSRTAQLAATIHDHIR
jgi:hypothetical protein